jgi:hypothetical protein
MEWSSVSSSSTADCCLDSSYSFASFQGAQPLAPFCISTTCIRLADVLRDQDFLAGTPAELSVAHHNFSTQFFTSAVHASSGDFASVLEISDDQMIALGDQIFELCAHLKMIKDDEHISKLLEPSLTVLQKRHDAWTSLRNSRMISSLSSPGPSLHEGDPHLTQPLARDALGQLRRKTPEELDEASAASARRAMATEISSSPARTLRDTASALSTGNMQFLQAHAGLFPVPVLGGWGSELIFWSPTLRLKPISDLQQMDSVFDAIFFDIIECNLHYVQLVISNGVRLFQLVVLLLCGLCCHCRRLLLLIRYMQGG